MRRRAFHWLAASALACGAIAVALWLLAPRPRLTEEHLARIRPGMTLAEVEEVLGGPAAVEWMDAGLVKDDRTLTSHSDSAGRRIRHPEVRNYHLRQWQTSGVAIAVAFVADGLAACRWRVT
jgi:hypothetical protein